MKQIGFFLAVLLMACTFVACGSDDGDETGGGGQKQPDNPDVPTQVKMKISVLLGADELDHPVPRLVAEWGDNMFAQVVDPTHPDVTVFQYINSDKADDVVAVVSEQNIIFMAYNPMSGADFPKEVLIASDNDGFSSLSSCTIDWKTGRINYGETIPFSNEAKTRLSTRGDNDALKEPFFKMFDDISSNIGKIKNQVKKFGAVGRSATLLCDIWTEALIPIMKYQLYDDDELAQRQYVQDYFTGKAMDAIKGEIDGLVDDEMDKAIDYLCEVTGVDREDVNLALWVYDNYQRPKDTSDDKLSDGDGSSQSQGMQAISGFYAKVKAGAPIFNETHVNPNTSVQVSMQVENVGEKSITLSGSVKIGDSSYASYSSAGYVYYVNGEEHHLKTSVDKNFNITSGTITGLEAATKYTIAAYYESLASNKTFYSAFEDVVTKGTVFELSKQKVEIPANGGQDAVQVKVGYETTWSVKSKPQWCTCTQQGNTLQVTVNENTGEERTDKIVLESVNYYKEKTTLTIEVKQESAETDDEGDDDDDDDDDVDDDDDDDGGDDVIGWYGTKWTFSGSLTISDSEDGTESGPVSMTIEIPSANSVNISSNVGTVVELFDGGTTKVEETADGLIITHTGSFSETDAEGSDTSTWKHVLTLRHTDATHATMDWTGNIVYSGWYLVLTERHSFSGITTFSGHFDGTRVK